MKEKKLKKTFLILFFILLFSTIIMKLIDSILLDLGYLNGSFHLYFWKNIDWYNSKNINKKFMMNHHPNFFWTFTQFTWWTTLIIFLIITLKILQLKEKNIPRWLKWIKSQNTISLITLYELIIVTFFWSAVFKDFKINFIPDLFYFEFTITFLVHLIIPSFYLSYSLFFLIYSKNAEKLKWNLLYKGMIVPTIYFLFYILISFIWIDPYNITHLEKNFLNIFWLILILIFVLFSIFFIIIIHNKILIKFNKIYKKKNNLI